MTKSPETAIYPSNVHYRFAEVPDHTVFYRDAGSNDAPAILLLHGFPTSSHVFEILLRFEPYPGLFLLSLPHVGA